MAFQGRRQGGTGLACALLVVACMAGSVSPARALFGLFGDDTPKPSPTALPYKVEFEAKDQAGKDAAVASDLQDASNLYKLRDTPPPDGESLVLRVQADFAPLIDALWGAGYYNARVVVSVADVPLELGRDREGAAARAANAYRSRDVVPVKVMAETGPLFKLRTVEVIDGPARRPFTREELPQRIIKLQPGDPAKAADLRAADARIVDWFRDQSRPLVKAPLPQPVVDHATETMDVTYVVNTGPEAGIGEVSVNGPQNFDQRIVRSFIYLEPGEPYTPKKLSDTRKSIASIPAVGSVRIKEADQLDAYGNLPIFVEVTDRAPNLVGFQAGFSTLDGPTSSVYYENRNLFGGAERLRLQADSYLMPRNNGTRIKGIEDIQGKDIGGRFTLSFLKPALDGTRFDALLDGIVERFRTGGGRFGGYTDNLAGATGALRYRFSDTFSVQSGLKYERGKVSDVISNVDYQIVGVPLMVRYDSTDKPLDPSQGFKVTASLTPYADFLGSSIGFTRANVSASTYFAFDEEKRFILAGRANYGTLFGDGGPLAQIPANYRFYAGGGNSVRGYRYQTIGPSGPFGFTIGGRTGFDASVEARIKVTDNIGVAPFVDIGGAYLGNTPFERGDTRASAGIGLLYYTAIGPFRVDVAAPINPRRGDKPLALYVSIGQSF